MRGSLRGHAVMPIPVHLDVVGRGDLACSLVDECMLNPAQVVRLALLFREQVDWANKRDRKSRSRNNISRISRSELVAWMRSSQSIIVANARIGPELPPLTHHSRRC